MNQKEKQRVLSELRNLRAEVGDASVLEGDTDTEDYLDDALTALQNAIDSTEAYEPEEEDKE